MGVKNAFLNGDLYEAVYMQPPEISTPPLSCIHLYFPIYCLKQALHTWFKKFHQSFLSAAYTKSFVDYTIFSCSLP